MTGWRGLLVAIVVAASAAAQEDAPAARNPREEAFRMVDAYVVSNMQESLSLSDEQGHAMAFVVLESEAS